MFKKILKLKNQKKKKIKIKKKIKKKKNKKIINLKWNAFFPMIV